MCPRFIADNNLNKMFSDVWDCERFIRFLLKNSPFEEKSNQMLNFPGCFVFDRLSHFFFWRGNFFKKLMVWQLFFSLPLSIFLGSCLFQIVTLVFNQSYSHDEYIDSSEDYLRVFKNSFGLWYILWPSMLLIEVKALEKIPSNTAFSMYAQSLIPSFQWI